MSVPDRLAIAIAQLNPIVGDVAGNADKARGARARAAAAGADLVLLPELFICGYPPEDLVLKPALQRSEEHTSELQSQFHLVCRLLLEKKKKKQSPHTSHPRMTLLCSAL